MKSLSLDNITNILNLFVDIVTTKDMLIYLTASVLRLIIFGGANRLMTPRSL